MAGMAVQIEAGTSETRQRPGDIAIEGWRNGVKLAVDFGITTLMDASAPDSMAQAKHVAYDSLCARNHMDFTAVIADAYGAVRGEGAKFLNSLSKLIKENAASGEYPTPQDIFWRGMSTAIIRRAAGAIAGAWGRVSSLPLARVGKELKQMTQIQMRAALTTMTHTPPLLTLQALPTPSRMSLEGCPPWFREVFTPQHSQQD